MKVWSNKKHEEILKEKKMKKLTAMQQHKPNYDTSCKSGNKSLEPSTMVSIDFSTNRKY